MQHFLIVGSGNLAWHLAPNLERIGAKVTIWSRHAEEDGFEWESDAPILRWTGESVDLLEQQENHTFDACFLAIPDDFISSVSQQLSASLSPQTPIVHTSGATAITAIDDYFDTKAALWPIRSLKKGEVVVPWTDLPLAYFSDSTQFEQKLAQIAKQLSQLTYHLNDEQRAHLHLAAVFSNNFTTWLCQISYELCQNQSIPFEALLPIIKNTFSKVDATEPALRQTGAAIRGDQKTMDRHVELLQDQPNYADLYRQISKLIVDSKSSTGK